MDSLVRDVLKNYHMREVKTVEVIRVEVCEGEGTHDDPA